MSKNITIELNEKYAEHLALLKQIIPNGEWKEITEDGEMVEALIDSFMSFIKEQANTHEHAEGGCCGGGWHWEGHWHGWWDECCGKHKH